MKKTISAALLETPLKLSFRGLEAVVSVLLLSLSILYLLEALPLLSVTSGGKVGPGNFPLGIACIAIALTSLLLIMSLSKRYGLHDARKVTFDRALFVLFGAVIIILIGSQLASLGAFFAPWIMATGIMFCCQERGLRLLVVPPCIGGAIYVLFVLALGVYFP
ncbi:tripartite tricarboxylate transporter TctB family protein [Marinomonas fungiae]|uniref:Tripartite tricarboxylate transporter TctB family n=1 Tax=Marinomonas fungiae TaxID=1137284 RepID=A0A0K6ISG8_9GAMM|nr:tripartite tricarboxylate transporter TctB family protein [Marinomonas fungiae]CUB06050.1 Tripartite tricarboxylate transporter TctB family [Marinomonas fungiae]